MTDISTTPSPGLTERIYRRRIWAWTMYDWANSAFATVVLTAVLPVYFSQVAGADLESKAIATARWSAGLSISLLVIAILSPVLGTVSDVIRAKKRLLALFAWTGILATGLLFFVERGDWILAVILFIVGRIGFGGANSFYDALLPHVAREEDRDRVSARGYALGYLGGGLILALDVFLIQILPGHLGARLSFLSVALWWAVFSLPVLLIVPEPRSATAVLAPGEGVITVSFKRLLATLRDIRQYRELFKFLVAFLIYFDGIGTIIALSVIYGSELGFGSSELILAILIIQFVGIPYSLIFGRLPSRENRRRPFYLAFVLFNLVALPLAGGLGSRLLPPDVSGGPPPPFEDTAGAAGEGAYGAEHAVLGYTGSWEANAVSARKLRAKEDAVYQSTFEPGARCAINFNGHRIQITYGSGPDCGIWGVEMDGKPLLDETGEPVRVDAYLPNVRYAETITLQAGGPGLHRVSLINSEEKHPASSGHRFSLGGIEVLPGIRKSNLGLILGAIACIEVLGFLLSLLMGPPLFSKLAEAMDTKRTLVLAIAAFAAITIWGYFLNSVMEFWFLAWMVAVVLGGSQALSRSLYASLAPAAKSGEFFGLFSVMEKFSSFFGPLLFAVAVAIFGSSRPAILSLILFFFLSGFLLLLVNVDEGRRLAREEDRELLPDL